MVLTTVLAMMRYVSETDDRDFVDRLHSYFTTNLLIGLSILISFKQFGGKPIECLVPDIFSGAWEQYAENYCWAQDTYFVAPSTFVENISKIDRGQRRISYYQWVPFFLLLEAACFRLPYLLWSYMSGHSGIKISEIIKMSSDPNNIKPEIRKANIRAMTLHLQGALRFHKHLKKHQIRPHRIVRLFNLPYSASYVTVIYLLTKFCYLFNVSSQLLIMNSFLETSKYSFYGFGALLDLLNGTTWEQSGVFPRVSLCDFEVRVMGNLQDYTIQCVLVINIFNEKIFVLLWFWYLCLLTLTFGSFLFWLSVVIFPWPNRRFIAMHLEMCEMTFDPYGKDFILIGLKKDVERFINDYLRLDGLFVIRLLTLHTGVIFGTELVQSLWINYFGYEGTALKRCSSFPDVNEFSPNSKNKKFYDIGTTNSRNRRHFDQHHSSVTANKSPKISVVSASEQLLHPPPFSPTAKRALNAIEFSRTVSPSSEASSRTASPPDDIGKKQSSSNNNPNIQQRKRSLTQTDRHGRKIEDSQPNTTNKIKIEERNQKESNNHDTSPSSNSSKYITARESSSSASY
uniref:Innexin n=1 Tax=Meloidogyne enterolobii TaxID=390850 RepID=A0A6V7WPA3_MELEN|nr:unnamed protein product [Meloidogyne enterolobii]